MMGKHELLLALAELEEAKRLLEWRRQVVLDMLGEASEDGDPLTPPPRNAPQNFTER